LILLGEQRDITDATCDDLSRSRPFCIRTKLNRDNGATWGDEIILRADGGNRDIGYPRTVQRADGTIVTVYYYNDQAEGERYIAATLWQPKAAIHVCDVTYRWIHQIFAYYANVKFVLNEFRAAGDEI